MLKRSILFYFLISCFHFSFAAINYSTENKTDKLSKKTLQENYEKIGGDPIAFSQAICFFEKYNNEFFVRTKLFPDEMKTADLSLKNKKFIVINDLNKPANTPRLFLINLETAQVSAYFSAHGSANPGQPVTLYQLGNLPIENMNEILFPPKISNTPGSFATSRGTFILDETYNGHFGNSLRMHGLQKNINENALSRLIVLHGFQGMNPFRVSSDEELQPIPDGNLALSQGCTMLEPQRAQELIELTKGGSLYYVYTDQEKLLSAQYCADENLMLTAPPPTSIIQAIQ